MADPAPAVADPFDLPDWIGAGECTWTTSDSVGQDRVDGVLEGAGTLRLSVLACDVAYPRAAVPERLRHDTHQAWTYGEVLVLREAAGYLLAVPGTALDVDLLCEAIRRFARAVGAKPAGFTVALQL